MEVETFHFLQNGYIYQVFILIHTQILLYLHSEEIVI
jgi:hypothetical protein